MVRTYEGARWVRRDADMARHINVKFRKPVRRIRFVHLACSRNWDEMFSRIDHGKAGVDDFDDADVCMSPLVAHTFPCTHSEAKLFMYRSDVAYACLS